MATLTGLEIVEIMNDSKDYSESIVEEILPRLKSHGGNEADLDQLRPFLIFWLKQAYCSGATRKG
jgi:hypothetical protein